MAQSSRSRRQMNPKRAALLLLVIVFCGGTTYGANYVQVRRKATEMKTQAQNAVTQGNRGDALDLYLNYLNFQNRDTTAMAEYAALIENDQNPKARRALLDTYERMLLIEPTRTVERRKLIKLYISYGMYPSARNHLNMLTEGNATGGTDDPEILDWYATVELKTGKLDDGLNRLRQLVKTRKAAPSSYTRLAEMLRSEGEIAAQPDEADQVMVQLLKDHPQDPEAYVLRSKYLLKYSDTKSSQAMIRQAYLDVREPEKHAELAIQLAQVFAADNRLQDAKDILSKSALHHPKNPSLRLVLTEILTRLNEKEAAAKMLQQATELAPDNDLVTVELIDTLIERNDLELARSEINRRYAGKDQFKPAYDYLMGRLALAEGNWPVALPAFERAAPAFERFPVHFVRAQIGIARCQKEANNPERMLMAYSRALVLDPKSTVARAGRGEAYLRLGRLGDAENDLKLLYETVPTTRYLMANARFQEQLQLPSAQRNWAVFEQTIGRAPYTVAIELLRSQLMQVKGQFEDAKKLLSTLVAAKPDEVTVRIAVAQFAARDSLDAALKELEQAEKVVGDKVSLRLAKASVFAAKGDPQAIANLAANTEQFKLDDKFLLWLGLAEHLANTGHPGPALAIVQNAAKLKPYDLTSRLLQVQFALESKQSAIADQALAEVKQLDGDAGPMYSYGLVLRDLSQSPDKSKLPDLRDRVLTVTKKRETWSRPHVILGIINEMLADLESASLHYRKAYDLGERTDVVQRRMLELLMLRGRLDEARRLLSEREKLGPLPQDLKQKLVLIDTSLGRAGPDSEIVVQQTEQSTDPTQQSFRGEYFLAMGKASEAIAAFEKATKTVPPLPGAWLGLIRAQLLKGDLVAAKSTVQQLEKSVAANPPKVPNATALTLGTAYKLVGDVAAAEKTYLDGLVAVPNDPAIEQELIQLYRATNRHAEATTRGEKLLSTTNNDLVKRWVRRNLASGKLVHPNPYSQLSDAIKLIDENLQNLESAEDLRAKGFLIAVDPFRRSEAHELITRSLLSDPMTPDELVRQAMLFVEEGRFDRAEQALTAATRASAAAPRALLGLHQVQCQLAKFDAAAVTLARIRKAIPGSWELAVEEARHAAKRGDKQKALDFLQNYTDSKKPEVQLRGIVPTLQSLGFTVEAESQLTQAMASTLPDRFTRQVVFFIETAQPLKAVRAAMAIPVDAMPPMQKLNLLRGAIAFRPQVAIPTAERAEWDKLVANAHTWVRELLAKNPKEIAAIIADAMILDATGKYEEAIERYETVLSQDPNNLTALNNLAISLVLHKQDKSQRPLTLMDKAIAAVGPRPFLLDSRAMVRTALGKHEDAITDITAAKVLEQKPVYDFHAAVVMATVENNEAKRDYLRLAKERGIKKEMLHPKEWPTYERLVERGE